MIPGLRFVLEAFRDFHRGAFFCPVRGKTPLRSFPKNGHSHGRFCFCGELFVPISARKVEAGRSSRLTRFARVKGAQA